MVVCESSINNIMGGIENTGGVTLHNHRRKLKQRFDIIKKLGQGTYGKVQLGINKETGQEVAIKTIKKCKIETEADLIRIRREIQIMSSVQHPNIIHIYEVFENREKMVLVMEYAAGGELYDYLSERKVLSEDEARRIFRQISTAVYYCHKHKICHRDLKLENILLDENGSAKIADFGLSNVFDDRRLLSTFCGSPLYASPEIVKGTPYHGPEVDCWSLGVLLYTLVYGAMPFDGSNFKRLVRQISQGDYFEPRKPSSASPLIREMLTVVPEKRANIENICAHWWVNANYDESCLEIAEDLANQTPVRLDLLLSLAPPPPQVGSDQLVIAGESSSMAQPVAETSSAPARSQSVGSLMELVPAAERRIRDLVDENKSPKRKLEVTVSTENANMSNSGAKRKEKLTKKPEAEDVPSNEDGKLCKNLTQTLVREELKPVEMAAENSEEINETDPNLQGAACTELIEESKKNEAKDKKKSVVKVVKKKAEKPSTEAENKMNDKENKDTNAIEQIESEKKDDTKIPKRKIIVKKKSVKEKSEEKPEESATTTTTPAAAAATGPSVKEEQSVTTENKTKNEEPASPPTKPVERRRSKIFETAEKFQNLVTHNDSKSSVLEKPKKIFIPGVNVGGFKKEFERKASLTSTVAPDLKKVVPKKTVPANKAEDVSSAKTEETTTPEQVQSPEPEAAAAKQATKEVEQTNEADKTKIESPVNEAANDDDLRKKNAVNIISNAITKEGTRKSKSRPCMMRKPPVPFGINGRSASGSIGLIPAQFSPTISKSPELPCPEENNVTSSAEINLKSATLPRRKTTKAEIKLDYPPPRPATMEFKTEMAHRIEGRPELKTQRSEIIVPVNNSNTSNNNVTNNRIRSTSLDPEIKPKESPKERIIPISFERDDTSERSDLQSPQAKPPMPKPFPVQRPPQRFGSLSRQSTHDSDSEATISENMEPIRKSPREYIIPIAVEGGGYVTPRATSLEPSDTSSGISSGRRSMPRFGRSKRVGENGSEEDLSFSSLHRHNSVGRDSDNEDSRREPFHMHRLRSSRPTRKENLEHADSLSSGEEDDDDGFEILTAENLFTTLLSRVRSLTQRINVEDNGRLGFPNSRLLGNFDHGSKLWNLHNDNLSRFTPFHREQSSVSSNNAAPWRRSVSRDLASDIERVFNSGAAAAATTPTTATTTATLPRDKSKKSKSKEANKYDLNELKLTDEDALALSYLTPGLSRRIQNQLFSQLPTLKRDRSRKLSQNSTDSIYRTKDYPFSDSSDSELFSDKYKHDNGSDDILNEYNFPRPPPKHSYSSSRASEYSPIAESPIMENKFPVNKVEPKIYRLEDIKKSYDKDKIEGFTKYTPYRHCYRSTSLIEPNTSNSYSNPIYFRNTNFSSENFDSKYNSENKTNVGGGGGSSSSTTTSNMSKYNTRPYLSSHSDETQDALASIRGVSRFGKPDYFDNCVYSKERQKREMETQKVLKEIRNKRINEHREKYRTRDKSNSRLNETIENGNHHQQQQQQQQKQKTVETSEPPIEKPPSNEVKEETKSIKREGKISKLIRPKSYPAENSDASNTTEIKTNGVSPEKTIKSKLFKRNTDKSSPAKDLQNTDDKKSNNQFLSSIEKKIRSLYSESPPPTDKIKTESPSRVQNTIRSLREQSEPRNIEHCVTESGLIKRAVSSEDFSVFGTNKPNTKTLQPSRKSVSKILGLFKKYEDKQPNGKSKNTEETSKKGKTDDSTKKKVKAEKTKTSSKNKKECTCNAEITPKEVAVKKSASKSKATSKLPVSSSSRNSSAEPETNLTNHLENDNKFVPIPDLAYAPDRRDLKLNLNKLPISDHPRVNDFLNDNREQSLPLFSPCDESNDSWSVCSDMHRQDMSPMSDNKLFSEEEANESVIDRIRRKSFYCRFNEKKKPRKTSLVENRYDYTKYDKYADTPTNAIKSRSLKDCATDQKSYVYTAPASTKESKLCKRALSMNDNYSYHKYGGSKSNANLSPEDKLLDAIDKNLNPKSKKSYLKTPTRFSDRITKSPPLNGNVGEGSSNNDVSAPL